MDRRRSIHQEGGKQGRRLVEGGDAEEVAPAGLSSSSTFTAGRRLSPDAPSTHLVRCRHSPPQNSRGSNESWKEYARCSPDDDGDSSHPRSRRSPTSSLCTSCYFSLRNRVTITTTTTTSSNNSPSSPSSGATSRRFRCHKRFFFSSMCMLSVAAVVPLTLMHRRLLLLSIDGSSPSAAHQLLLGAAFASILASRNGAMLEKEEQGKAAAGRCCVVILPGRGALFFRSNVTSSSRSASSFLLPGRVNTPLPLRRSGAAAAKQRYFGRLEIRRAPQDELMQDAEIGGSRSGRDDGLRGDSTPFARAIDPRQDEARYETERRDRLREMDENADPNDFSHSEPGRYDHFDDFSWPVPSGCYRPRWSYNVRPTCNAFHEMTLDRGLGKSSGGSRRSALLNGDAGALPGHPLGVGHYRLSWLVSELSWQRAPPSTGERTKEETLGDFVLKLLRLNRSRNFNHKTFSEIQIEALAFTLSTASPRTTDMYGHCGTSLAVERGTPIDESIRPDREFLEPDDLDELSKAGSPLSKNPYTPQEKLEMAVAMAESLAELHGNPSGPIVNNDVKIDQWVMTPSGYKLNDFNKGRVLRWNPDQRRYCTIYSSYDTVYRAPEELEGDHVDVSPDVYALGKVLYTLLTGRQPHFEHGSKSRAIRAILNGTEPWIDPRFRDNSSSSSNTSFGGDRSTATAIDRILVDIMERCWAHRPEDRPSIFAVVKWLREATRLYLPATP